MIPHRVQRQRKKGWKMPRNTVYVGRPGKWGNPIEITYALYLAAVDISQMQKEKVLVGNEGEKAWFPYATAISLQKYKKYLEEDLLKREDIKQLKGKNLACWCRICENKEYVHCHADILLSLANDVPIETIRENNLKFIV